MRYILLAIVAVILAAGCTGPAELLRVEEKRAFPPNLLALGDAITFIGFPSVSDEMLECIDNTSRDGLPKVHVMPHAEFRRSMLPWFESNRLPGAEPGDVESLSRILLSPIVRQRVDDLRIRYLISLSATLDTQDRDWNRSYEFIVMFGGETRETISLKATILDMRKIKPVAEIQAAAEGTHRVGIILFIPYVLTPDTTKVVCKAIANRLVNYFKGDDEAPSVKRN